MSSRRVQDPHVFTDFHFVAVAEDGQIDPFGLAGAGGEAGSQRFEAGVPVHQGPGEIVRVRGFRRQVVEALEGDFPARHGVRGPAELHQGVPEFVLGVRNRIAVPVADGRAGSPEAEVGEAVEGLARRESGKGLDEVTAVRLVADPVTAAELFPGLQQVARAPGGERHDPSQCSAAEDRRVGSAQDFDALEEVRIGEESPPVRAVEVLPSPVLADDHLLVGKAADVRRFGDPAGVPLNGDARDAFEEVGERAGGLRSEFLLRAHRDGRGRRQERRFDARGGDDHRLGQDG